MVLPVNQAIDLLAPLKFMLFNLLQLELLKSPREPPDKVISDKAISLLLIDPPVN